MFACKLYKTLIRHRHTTRDTRLSLIVFKESSKDNLQSHLDTILNGTGCFKKQISLKLWNLVVFDGLVILWWRQMIATKCATWEIYRATYKNTFNSFRRQYRRKSMLKMSNWRDIKKIVKKLKPINDCNAIRKIKVVKTPLNMCCNN